MEVIQNQLDCTRCNFHGPDYKSTQIHMGTIHPEFCEEINTGGLGKLVFYQKSARLFHCHRCFFTSKMFSNVYYHILDRHPMPDKWNNEKKAVVQPKSEPLSELDSDKNDSESVASEDNKYVDEQDQSKINDNDVKSDENDTLTSWPEKAPSQDNPDNSDSDFKSSSIEKASEMSAETKDKDSSSDSESSSSSSHIKSISVKPKVHIEFSDNDATPSPSKDIPEFSDDDDDELALPGGIPHFSDDEDTVPETKDLEESSEDDALADPSRGIEDISEDEMPPVEKPTDNVLTLAQSNESVNSSEDEEHPSVTGKEMDFSEDEDDNTRAMPKDLDFSEDEVEETIHIPKNAMDFSDEEETAVATTNTKNAMDFSDEEETTAATTNTKNTMDFSDEEETAAATKNIMEFSEEEDDTNVSKNMMEFSEEGTSGLSKDIMEFSEEDDDDDDDDTPAISKSIMEFSDEEDVSPDKNMPKYLEGDSTPTPPKDSVEESRASVLKESFSFSEDEDVPDERTSPLLKDCSDTSTDANTSSCLPVINVSEYKATPWSKDKLETINPQDLSLSIHDPLEASDDKDGFLKDEEILKHVKRVKGRYYCLLCDCRPLKRGPILHHLITRHNMPSPFVCKTCGKTFVMETHLKHHLASHTKGLYKCHRCNFQTDHARGFKKHQTHCENRHKEEASNAALEVQDIPEAGDEEDDLTSNF